MPSRLRIVLRYARSLSILPFLLTGMVAYAIFAPDYAKEDVSPVLLCLLGAAILLIGASVGFAMIWILAESLS